MHPSSQRVLMLEAPRRAHLADRPLAPPGAGDVVLRSRYSTFKHGTEMMAYRGDTPHASRAFDPSLRLFESVPTPKPFYPRPMGSMVVGTVEWAGEQAGDLRPGEQVFGWAPIADVHVMPATSLQRLGQLTPEQVLCIDPASFGLGAVLDGDIRPAETVLVTGLGAIGQFAIQYCAAAGAHVVAASGFEERRRLARSLGAAEVYDTSAGGDVARLIKEGMAKERVVKEDLVKEDLVKEGIDGVDVAIECSGSL